MLILDALRPKPHATHFGLDEAIAVARSVRTRRAFLPIFLHELEHQATSAILPPGMELAYDGLCVPMTLKLRPTSDAATSRAIPGPTGPMPLCSVKNWLDLLITLRPGAFVAFLG